MPALHMFLLDTSDSMRRGGRLALAKGYAARLVEQAARAGDDACVLAFGGAGAELLLPPGPARSAGALRVGRCGGGGGTPLAQALALAQRVLAAHAGGRGRDAVLWLLSDGRTLEQPAAPPAAGRIVIVDFDHPDRPLGRCAAWAGQWGAEHRPAPSLPS
jgi:magnesium chelatase subunit ChlD-like protein